MASTAARFWRSFFGMKSGNKQYYSKNTMQGAKSWTNIYMVGGMVLLGMGVGISTASQHLIHSPGCLVSKKKRLSFPELELSGDVMNSGKKYGICQKLGRFNYTIGGRSNASSPDPYQQSVKSMELSKASPISCCSC